MPHIDQFVHEENVRRLRDGIARETDPKRVAVLKTLLEEELARAPHERQRRERTELIVFPRQPPSGGASRPTNRRQRWRQTSARRVDRAP